MFLQISLGALLLGLFIGSVAFAQTSFFQGKTITILESSAPGGVGSMRTKAIVPFLQKHIPGNPTVVIQYMDGCGGRKAGKRFRPGHVFEANLVTDFAPQSHAQLLSNA